VRVIAVDALAFGIELVGEEVVVEATTRPGEGGVSVRSVEIAAIGAERQFWCFACSRTAEHGNDASHRVGAVERALRSTEKFDPVGTLQRNGTEVEGAARFVDRDAIHDDLVVGGVSAAREDGGQAAALARDADDDTGEKADSV